MSDWKARIEDSLNATVSDRQGNQKQRSAHPLLHFNVKQEWIGLLSEAARQVGMTRSGFVRRACSIQIAHVLGMNIYEVLAWTPKPFLVVGYQVASSDDGDQIEVMACSHCGHL